MSTLEHRFSAGADNSAILISIVSALLLCAGLRAVAADATNTPYWKIAERNVFGLRAPPAAEQSPLTPRLASKITLTGITTIFGDKRALLKMQAPARVGQPPTEQSYILAEGQRDGEIQVLSVDEKAGTVKVNYAGVVTTIDFVNYGVPGPSGSMASSADRLPVASAGGGQLAQATVPSKIDTSPGGAISQGSRLEAAQSPPKVRMSRRLAFTNLPQ